METMRCPKCGKRADETKESVCMRYAGKVAIGALAMGINAVLGGRYVGGAGMCKAEDWGSFKCRSCGHEFSATGEESL